MLSSSYIYKVRVIAAITQLSTAHYLRYEGVSQVFGKGRNRFSHLASCFLLPTFYFLLPTSCSLIALSTDDFHTYLCLRDLFNCKEKYICVKESEVLEHLEYLQQLQPLELLQLRQLSIFYFRSSVPTFWNTTLNLSDFELNLYDLLRFDNVGSSSDAHGIACCTLCNTRFTISPSTDVVALRAPIRSRALRGSTR